MLHSGATAPDPDTLMLHCSLARHESLLPLAQAAGVKAVLPDLLGHGRSPDWSGTRDYLLANVEQAALLLDRPMHVLGHSLGAVVALKLALDHPDRVNRLTLIEPVFFAAARGTQSYQSHVDAFAPIQTAMQAGDPKQAARLFHAIYGTGDWDRIPPATQDSFARRMALVFASTPGIEDDVHDILPRLNRIDCPVCMIRGSDSHPVIAAIHTALRDAMPTATDHVVDGAGHMSPLTHTTQVAALLGQ